MQQPVRTSDQIRGSKNVRSIPRAMSRSGLKRKSIDVVIAGLVLNAKQSARDKARKNT